MNETGSQTKSPTLAQLIEKITDSGLVTRNDQETINTAAKSGEVTPNDAAALNRLTSMITQGAIKVA